MKKHCLVIFSSFLLMASSILAQGDGSGYTTGIGLRAGFNSGLSIKHFIKSEAALEGIIGTQYRARGLNFTGLYEIIKPNALEVNGLCWEYGGGFHAGYYSTYYYGRKHFYDDHYERRAFVGIVGILGLEYQISEIPFTIGLDLMPYLDFIGYHHGFLDGSLSVRYVIK